MTSTVASRLADPGAIAAQLQEARDRTFLLLAPLTDDELRLQQTMC